LIEPELLSQAQHALHKACSAELDRQSVPQEKLDIRERVRTSAFPWRGQFSPGLVETLLTSDGNSPRHVLDPFAGSGTTLFEAMRLGIRATAYEINPAALELSKVALLGNLDNNDRVLCLKDAAKIIDSCFGAILMEPLEQNGSIFGMAEKAYYEAPNGYVANLVAVTIMLAMGSSRTLKIDGVYKSFKWIRRVVESFPPDAGVLSVEAQDARSLPDETCTVDMVLTSPPYINVFNYHQNYRPAMELLGWDILPIARSEIGSNRANRGNRLLTVTQYCIDMSAALLELARVVKDTGQIVIVIGRESNVRGVAFANGEILAALALLTGRVELQRWQERQFTNRFGLTIFEDLLTLKVIPGHAEGDALSIGRAVAFAVLSAAQDRAPSDVAYDLKDALDRVPSVQGSPRLVRATGPRRPRTAAAGGRPQGRP
jgi:hypothetical protein